MIQYDKPILLPHVRDEDYLNIDEAAHFLGITNGSLRNYLTWGWLNTYKFKTLTLIAKAELIEWKKTKQR
jgi:hypothetical protein